MAQDRTRRAVDIPIVMTEDGVQLLFRPRRGVAKHVREIGEGLLVRGGHGWGKVVYYSYVQAYQDALARIFMSCVISYRRILMVANFGE